jgi:hypothetical protein
MITRNLDLLYLDQPAVEPKPQAPDRANVQLLSLGTFPFDPLRQDNCQELGKDRQALGGWEKLAKIDQLKICYHTHARRFLGIRCAVLNTRRTRGSANRCATLRREKPRYLICDNYKKYGSLFETVARTVGVEVIDTPYNARPRIRSVNALWGVCGESQFKVLRLDK